MRTAPSTIVSFLAFSGVVLAQTQTTVVPVANTAVEGNSLEAKPYTTDRVRLTQLLDRTIVNVPFGKTITEIAYRRDKTALPTQTLARRTTPTWSLRLANLDYKAPPQRVGRVNYPGGAAWNPRNPVGVYLHPALTLNRLVEVYNKITAFPSLPPVTGATAPFAILFKLDRPFVYTGPDGLAIDQYAYETRNQTSAYYVDAVRASTDTGRTSAFGKSCPADRNRAHAIPTNPGGEPLSLLLFDAPPQSVAVAIIGASNRNWGAIPLPLNLGPFGLTPCHVYVSFDIALPVPTFTSGSAAASFRLPPDPGLAGLRFYAQWMVVDSRVNPSFPLAFSNGMDVTLGTTVGSAALPAAFIYGQNVSAVVRGTYGLVDKGITLVTRITYQ